jgi:hypothetical protein
MFWVIVRLTAVAVGKTGAREALEHELVPASIESARMLLKARFI